MIILGIDPGSVRVGFGIIKKEGGILSYIEGGILNIPQEPKNERLITLEKELQKILTKHNPDRVGIEKLFIVKNQKTASEVAESRGVIMWALQRSKTKVIELSPREVKSGITGDGSATKSGVARMVRLILKDVPKNTLIDDATDALAISIVISNRIVI